MFNYFDALLTENNAKKSKPNIITCASLGTRSRIVVSKCDATHWVDASRTELCATFSLVSQDAVFACDVQADRIETFYLKMRIVRM